MWEKVREDGSRRLKCDAVPTIFCFSKELSKRKAPKERKIKSPLKKNMFEKQLSKIQNQSTEINVNLAQSNQNRSKYEHILKKMKEYER